MFLQANLIDLLLVGSFGAFIALVSWHTVGVFIACAVLKAVQPMMPKASKRDDVARLEEQIKKVSSDIKGLNLKLGFERNR